MALSACGGPSAAPEASSAAAGARAGRPPSAAPAVSFPSASGRTLADLRADAPVGLVLAPSVSVLQQGGNRFGFALFDAARRQVAEAPVALYVSRGDGSGLRGPYTAHSESLAVRPQFRSATTANDAAAAKSVYVADLSFPKPGRYRVTALIRLDGRDVSTEALTVVVTQPEDPRLPPSVGQLAPKVSTPTLTDVAGDAARISTRVPVAPELLKTDLADVYGRKPVALLFATPALCQSRVCGPVVDILEQVRAEQTSGDVAFITTEIYRQNRVDMGLRSQPAAYRIPTEPWLFLLDRDGRVAERLEGAFSAHELRSALARLRAQG